MAVLAQRLVGNKRLLLRCCEDLFLIRRKSLLRFVRANVSDSAVDTKLNPSLEDASQCRSIVYLGLVVQCLNHLPLLSNLIAFWSVSLLEADFLLHLSLYRYFPLYFL